MSTLIAPNDHWSLWTMLVGAAALAILLEQKSKISSKLTGPVMALAIGAILSNVGVVPTKAVTYDIVWDYVVILAIPLLLMKANIRRIVRETGRMFGAFHLSALGTFVGAIVAVACFHRVIEEAAKVGGIMTASYIGGGVNFLAMVATFKPSESIANATIVADNAIMAVYFIILLALPGSALVRKVFPLNERSKALYGPEAAAGAAAFWKPKPISLLDIALALSLAFVIATGAVKISGFFGREQMPGLVQAVLGQKFLMLTTLSVLLPLIFPKFTENLSGTDELGTFFIYIFFVLIGIPASLKTIILESPLLLVFCAVMLFFNFFVTIVLGKLFRLDLEELILVAAATAGGPMSAAAIAIAKGWQQLIVPSFLVGIWGYVIGTYLGYITGQILLHILP